MNCSEWSDIFLLVQGVVSDWPEGYQFRGADLCMVGKSACPPLQERVIYDHYQFLGDIKFSRILAHMEVRYQWGNNLGAKNC